MIPASERAKTVNALDRSAAVTGFTLTLPYRRIDLPEHLQFYKQLN
jgi:hypothetical protein